jgi:hypothetical protein
MDLTVTRKENKNQRVMCCVEITSRGFSLVVSLLADNGQNQVIVLERFESMVAAEISRKIKLVVEKYSLYGAPCIVVLHPTDYNLFLIDKPNVAKNELQKATKWVVKDMVQYPLDQLVMDVFPSPHKHKLFVVATEQNLIERIVDALGMVGLRLFKVTITELAIMKVLQASGQLPDSYCFLHVAQNTTLLLHVEHGLLSYVKRLPAMQKNAMGDGAQKLEQAKVFIGELKRVFSDLLNVHHKEVHNLVVSPGGLSLDAFITEAEKDLGCIVTLLNLSHVLTSSLNDQDAVVADYVSALGGSLYSEV